MDKLPSRGLSYPKDAKIKYRSYTFGEVRTSSTGGPSSEAGQIVNVIEASMKGIETEGMRKDNITFLDALYLGVMRKISSVQNSSYEIPYYCMNCGASNKAIFSEKDLDFAEISEEVKALPLVAEVAGKELNFEPMTVKQFLELQKGRYNRDLADGKIDRVAMNAMMITNMEFKEAYQLLYNLKDPLDVEVVEEVDKLLLHDIKPIKAVCKAELKDEGQICNFENQINLGGKEQLIRPFREGERTARSRIRLGVPQDS